MLPQSDLLESEPLFQLRLLLLERSRCVFVKGNESEWIDRGRSAKRSWRRIGSVWESGLRIRKPTMDFISSVKICCLRLLLLSFCLLGFFSPEGSINLYVGIWYNLPQTQVIWVANREKPLTDSSGVLRLSEQGNVVVMNGRNETLWSSNVSSSSAESTVQLLDSGNLVFIEHLGNTFFQKSKLINYPKIGEKMYLTSWLTEFDPSHGNFTATVVPLSSNTPECSAGKWGPNLRNVPWNGQVFIGVPIRTSLYLNEFCNLNEF
uniref:Bulb-type lectin domain-containing protein n=1 Tax=Kalanchoe fedtschenkoi TaxID=63787 RepID=A0A7N0UL12_KALFE